MKEYIAKAASFCAELKAGRRSDALNRRVATLARMANASKTEAFYMLLNEVK